MYAARGGKGVGEFALSGGGTKEWLMAEGSGDISSFEVGSDEPVGMLSDLLKIDVRCERHGTCVDFEDLQTRLRVGDSDFDFAIEAPGTS